MGIPAFYRWLVDRYPMSVVDMVEEVPLLVNGVPVPVDASKPNPNGVEFDNLYLDMNGIIHPCFHPEDQLAPKSYEDVFKAIFQYIDHIFSMVRPRKLLYMAIDGVAPRAKMNQQRARRFRAAKDAADAAAEAEELRSTLIQDTEKLALLDHVNKLDSNVITPGTEFMATLSTALHYYTHLRLNTDPGWRGIKDADLIMLALATHEIHFAILREDVRGSHQKDTSQKIRKDASRTASQQGKQEMKRKEADKTDIKNDASRQKFQLVQWYCGEMAGKAKHQQQAMNSAITLIHSIGYLQHEFRIPDSTVKIDLERVIDDFVFMCLFVGNDFLPHMPSLEISEGAIDLLMYVYKKEFVRMGGYLINSFEIDLERAAHFIQAVGSYENAIFRRRNQLHKERETRFQESSNVRLGGSSAQGRVRGKGSKDFWSSFSHTGDFISQESQNTYSVMDLTSLEMQLNAVVQQNKVNGFAHMVSNGSQVKGTAVDQIRLGEEGWKERYYAEKFEVQTEDDYKRVRKHAGYGSKLVFYPYHYAPFASDFCGLDQLEILFTPGEPFKPFDQLMGVLPTARKLLTDSSSPIADFYPDDFELDMNGKRYSWQAVCKLPFIKESRLLAEIAKVEDTLTDEEKQRNSFGADVLFVHISHHLAGKIMSSYRRKKDHPKLLKAKIKRKIDPSVRLELASHCTPGWTSLQTCLGLIKLKLKLGSQVELELGHAEASSQLY
ncbi:hypothetical protein ACLOJK_033810 [Asimina triloba]